MVEMVRTYLEREESVDLESYGLYFFLDRKPLISYGGETLL
jgi:hypothetical protein